MERTALLISCQIIEICFFLNVLTQRFYFVLLKYLFNLYIYQPPHPNYACASVRQSQNSSRNIFSPLTTDGPSNDEIKQPGVSWWQSDRSICSVLATELIIFHHVTFCHYKSQYRIHTKQVSICYLFIKGKTQWVFLSCWLSSFNGPYP